MLYADIDEKILKLIDFGTKDFGSIVAKLHPSQEFDSSFEYRRSYHLVDRRLQSLRKRGVIHYDRAERVWKRGT